MNLYDEIKKQNNTEVDLNNVSRKTLIIGGGTVNYIRNHFAISAPAYGKTARYIKDNIGNKIGEPYLLLTKMANSISNIETNDDLKNIVDEIILDKSVKCIVFNAAVADFEGVLDGVESGKYAQRLKTKNGNISVDLKSSHKIISKIRVERPDIFLVGFKTTTYEDESNQFLIALNMMKKTKCNLVLANDLGTKINMIITPEESSYSVTSDRDKVLNELIEFVNHRGDLTYKRTQLHIQDNYKLEETTSKTFQEVLKFVVNNGGYIENNGNGFTPGHFCQKINEHEMVSSQRKADHNKVFKEGLTKVSFKDNEVFAYGNRKPSVGATSQWLMLEDNPEYDCIIHTHNPIKKDSLLKIVEQKPYQCGSQECGLNTVNNLVEYSDNIKAVFLEKHGVNILFKSKANPKEVINFINMNIDLGKKIGFEK